MGIPRVAVALTLSVGEASSTNVAAHELVDVHPPDAPGSSHDGALPSESLQCSQGISPAAWDCASAPAISALPVAMALGSCCAQCAEDSPSGSWKNVNARTTTARPVNLSTRGEWHPDRAFAVRGMPLVCHPNPYVCASRLRRRSLTPGSRLSVLVPGIIAIARAAHADGCSAGRHVRAATY